MGSGEDLASSSTIAPRERKLSTALIPAAVVVVIMWSAYLLDRSFDLSHYRHGILPRHWQGLWGIVVAPFIHGDLEHLINNSIPMLVLGWALLYFFPRLAGRVALGSWLVSGVLVWLSARSNYHIGASGVVYGLAAFLFTSGLLRGQRTLMGLSLLVVFLYGGLLWGVLPIVPRISWESHFWGAATGVSMAYLYRHVPAAVNDPKPIVWDEEEEPARAGSDLSLDPPPLNEDHRGPSDPNWSASDSWNNGSGAK